MLADTSAAQLAYIEETVLGTTPGSGTEMYLRMTGESLAYDIQTESSKEINSTGQVSDFVHVGASAQGGINLELSYREYDNFLEALLRSTFVTGITGATDGRKNLTLSFDSVAGTITDDGVNGIAGTAVGQWFSVIGGANAGVYRIGSRTDDQITVDTDTPLVSTAAGVACALASSRLAIGTAARRAFSIEKQFTDVDQYFVFAGMTPSKLELNFETGAFVTGSFSFMGMSSVRSGATQLPNGAPTASQTFGIMNAVTGTGNLFVDGNTTALAGTYVKSTKLSVDQKLRGRTGIGTMGFVDVGRGTFDIGGTLEVYLYDGSLYDTAIANTAMSLEWTVKDGDNNGYAFIFPSIKLGVPTVVAGAMDSDVMLSIPWRARAANTSTDKMMRIDRFGVVRQ